MSRTMRIVAPIVVLAIGGAALALLVKTKPEPETRVPEVALPLVRVQTVKLEDVQVSVSSQGTVRPRTESVVVSEVWGRVIEVAPGFVGGGFFEKDEVLLRLDPHDYRQVVVEAEARVSQAELRVTLEQAEAEVARREWEELGAGQGSPLTLREPQVADARATLAAAHAVLERARRDLERTEIRAPYAGRVRDKQVDIGQFVNRGAPLATIYAVDYAEVRLPLPDDELAFVELPLRYRGDMEQQPGPEVVLRASFAGRVHEWRGRIVRTEGEIDPMTRMVHTVARVKDPYARDAELGRPPLAAGLFVEAEILGEMVSDVVIVPRSALRGQDRLLVVDDDDRLRFRTVDVLRRTGDRVIVRSGLEDGERICLSPLAAVTDGMQVRTQDDAAIGPPSPERGM